VGEVIPLGIPLFKIPLLPPPVEKPLVSFASGVQGGLGKNTGSGSGRDGGAKVPQAAGVPECDYASAFEGLIWVTDGRWQGRKWTTEVWNGCYWVYWAEC